MTRAAQLEEPEENYRPAPEEKQMVKYPLHSEVWTHNTNQTQGQTTTGISDRKMNTTVQQGKPGPTLNFPEANSGQTEESN